MDGGFDPTLELSSLSYDFKNLLRKLNIRRILTTDGPVKILRDWRGVAYLLGISNDELIEGDDKISRILEIWIQRNDGTATLGHLMNYLTQMDRYDIFDDIIELAETGKLVSFAPRSSYQLSRLNGFTHDSNIITYDDRKSGRPTYYHAYVVFAKEDWAFVRLMLSRMRDQNFKMCTEFDIDIGCPTQYSPVSRLIEERCALVILVYSPDFLNSRANTFYSDYAQAASIESKCKLIPIVYRQCSLPHNLRYYHKLMYNEDEKQLYPYVFWDKLRETLAMVQLPATEGEDTYTDTEVSNSSVISELRAIEAPPSLPQEHVSKSLNNLHDSSEISISKKKKNRYVFRGTLTRLKNLVLPNSSA